MGPEKHLGYAVQWFGLAVALLIIYLGVNTRRDGSDGNKHVRA
jgi:cytochrome oxidase assembly protein ShyY1